jgi:hypothetical protein
MRDLALLETRLTSSFDIAAAIYCTKIHLLDNNPPIVDSA